MVSRKTKRVWGLGGLATTMALAMTASAAFACTVYRGKSTVTGANGGLASADGSGSFHDYCGAHPRGDIISTTGLITVAVAKSTKCTAVGLVETQLTNTASTWQVYWVAARHADSVGPTTTNNATVDGVTDPEFFNCNSNTLHNSRRKHLGTLSVSSGGAGSGTFNLLNPNSAPATPGPGNVCVNDGSGNDQSVSAPQVYINWI